MAVEDVVDFLEAIQDEEISNAWRENAILDELRVKLHEIVELPGAEQGIKDLRWLIGQLKWGDLRW